MNETITWISVDERLPTVIPDVLAWDGEQSWQSYHIPKGWAKPGWYSGSNQQIEGVTHWAEMPKGPEVET